MSTSNARSTGSPAGSPLAPRLRPPVSREPTSCSWTSRRTTSTRTAWRVSRRSSALAEPAAREAVRALGAAARAPLGTRIGPDRTARGRSSSAGRRGSGRSTSRCSRAGESRSPGRTGRGRRRSSSRCSASSHSRRAPLRGRGVPGVIGQERSSYASSEVLLDSFARATGLTAVDARTTLAKFGLGADHVTRACTTLSPGERTRAHLAELQESGVNLLVLDEPTNTSTSRPSSSSSRRSAATTGPSWSSRTTGAFSRRSPRRGP